MPWMIMRISPMLHHRLASLLRSSVSNARKNAKTPAKWELTMINTKTMASTIDVRRVVIGSKQKVPEIIIKITNVCTLVIFVASSNGELGYLRHVFEEKYGNFLEYFVNQKFIENLASKPSIMENKIQLTQGIASEFLIRCDSKAFERTMSKPPVSAQALFYFSLRQMLKPECGDKEPIGQIDQQIPALGFHIQNYYWLDFTLLSDIYNKSEECPYTALNKDNVILEPIEDWGDQTESGGYLIGNSIPAHMDFWWFLVGKCIVILSSLATAAQAPAIMDLIEGIWEDLIREMPLKIAYPGLEEHQWKIVTGRDLKNTQFSYHSGESRSAASIKTGTPQIGKRAIGLVEQCLSMDWWPEYFDGKTGRYIGKQATKYQTCSIAGYLVVKMMIENPSYLLFSCSLDQAKTHPQPFMSLRPDSTI